MEPSLGGLSDSAWHSFMLIFFFSCRHQYPELLVASYNNNEEAPHEPDGVALVWNMKYKKATPEYVFHCQVTNHNLSASFPHFPLFLSPLVVEVYMTSVPQLPLSLPSCVPPSPSFTLWVHCAGIHLHHIYLQTHVGEAPERTCGAGFEWNPGTAVGLSVWGRAGYHVHLNKGPVFRRAMRESSRVLLHSAQP